MFLVLLLFADLCSFIFSLAMKNNLDILEIFTYIKLSIIGINILLFLILLFYKSIKMPMVTKIIIGIVIIYNLINSILLIKKIKDIHNSNNKGDYNFNKFASFDIILFILSMPIGNWLFMNNLL